MNASNFPDGYPCLATAGKINTEFFSEDVGQFFDNKIGHVGAHLLGEHCVWPKSLISMGKSKYFDLQARK